MNLTDVAYRLFRQILQAIDQHRPLNELKPLVRSLLVEHKVDIDFFCESSEQGYVRLPLLYHAVQAGEVELVTYLHEEYKASFTVDAVEEEPYWIPDGASCLFLAIQTNRLAMVAELLRLDRSLLNELSEEYSPLLFAIHLASQDPQYNRMVFFLLLQPGINLELRAKIKNDGDDAENNGMNALHMAAYHGNLPLVRRLVQHHHMDINTLNDPLDDTLGISDQDETDDESGYCFTDTYQEPQIGCTALLYAVRQSHSAIVEFLLEQASVDLLAKEKTGGATAFSLAITVWLEDPSNETKKSILLTIASHLKKNFYGDPQLGMEHTRQLKQGLRQTLKTDDLENFQLLFNETEMSPESSGSNKGTLIHDAVHYNAENILTFLLNQPAYQAVVNQLDSYGQTALHYAAKKKKDNLLRILRNCPDIDLNPRQGNTKRAVNRREALAGVPKSYFAGMSLRDLDSIIGNDASDPEEGSTPLHAALRHRGVQTVRFLASQPEVDLDRKKTPDHSRGILLSKLAADRETRVALKIGMQVRNPDTTLGESDDDSEHDDEYIQETSVRKRHQRAPNRRPTVTQKTIQRLKSLVPDSLPRENCLVLFRGLHFKKAPIFSEYQQRKNYGHHWDLTNTQPVYADAIYHLLGTSVNEPKFDDVIYKDAGLCLKKALDETRRIPSRKRGYQHQNVFYELLHMYVNNPSAVEKDAKFLSVLKRTHELLLQKHPTLKGKVPAPTKAKSPFISTSTDSGVAIKFAMGHCLYGNNQHRTLKVRESGQTKNRRLGVVFIMLVPASAVLATNDATNVLAALQANKIGVNGRYRQQREFTFNSTIDAEYIVRAVPILAPSFEFDYDESYLELYGLDEKKFNAFKTGFFRNPHQASEEYRALEKKLIEHLKANLQKTIEQEINAVMTERKQECVYLDNSNELSHTKPPVPRGNQPNPPVRDVLQAPASVTNRSAGSAVAAGIFARQPAGALSSAAQAGSSSTAQAYWEEEQQRRRRPS